MSRARGDNDSLLGLVGSFFGVNLMIAGVFLVLTPHLVATRVARTLRRLAPPLRGTRQRWPAAARRARRPSSTAAQF